MSTITINARPHKGQAEVHKHEARFKVLAAGRRWGKTRLGVNECLTIAADGGRAWWIAPSYKLSEVGWRPLRRMGAKIGAEVRKVDRQIILPGGGEVTVRSADDPQSLRGEGLDFVVMDECAFMQEAAWTEAIRPALSDRLGSALFISTPKGRNWFWRMFIQGQDKHDNEIMSWCFPTSSNPYIDLAEIEAARKMLPERIFSQEYLAEFIDDAGGVFRRVMDAATAREHNAAEDGRQYIAGVDVASKVDFTAVCVMDVESKELVYLDRFNRVDYNVLEDRLQALYKRFKLDLMIIESNSIGQPVLDNLIYRGMAVQGFTTSNATKHAIIRDLSSAFEHSEIKILNDPILIGELQAYEGERNKAGTSWSYGAPEGLHDDTVMALAIAWSGISKRAELIDDPFADW